MCSHPMGQDVWFLIAPFVYFHTSCVRTAKAGETTRMRRLTWAFAGRLCEKYHNLTSWLIGMCDCMILVSTSLDSPCSIGSGTWYQMNRSALQDWRKSSYIFLIYSECCYSKYSFSTVIFKLSPSSAILKSYAVWCWNEVKTCQLEPTQIFYFAIRGSFVKFMTGSFIVFFVVVFFFFFLFVFFFSFFLHDDHACNAKKRRSCEFRLKQRLPSIVFGRNEKHEEYGNLTRQLENHKNTTVRQL